MELEIRDALRKGAARPSEPADPADLYRRGTRQRRLSRLAAAGAVAAVLGAATVVLPISLTAPSEPITFDPSTTGPAQPVQEQQPPIAFRSCPESGCGLFIREPDGHVRRLTSEKDDRTPTWSPDGARIAFTRDGTGGGLYAIDADGSDEQQLSDHVAVRPQWSPEGSWVAFLRGEDGRGNATELAVVTADGSRGRVLSTDTDAYSWAPDGSRVAALVSNQPGAMELRIITVVGLDSGIEAEVDLVVPLTGLHTPTIITAPAWSPDGSRILFAAADTPDQFRTPRLYEVSADGSSDPDVVADGLLPHRGSWSPDGTKIAVSRAATANHVLESTVVILTADGSRVGSLQLEGRDAFAPEWSKDAERLYALTWNSDHAGHWGYAYLTATDADGRNPRDLLSGVTFDFAVGPNP